MLTAENLRNYDAVYFFTSGELPLSDQQKADLLDFVRSGKGFGGSHSATDCLYTWPEYGEMIGGYFDGHPWAQEASVDVEDAQSPLLPGAAPAFRFIEEFYQFRDFSRDRVRVLLTLDTGSVDMAAPGINRTDGISRSPGCAATARAAYSTARSATFRTVSGWRPCAPCC